MGDAYQPVIFAMVLWIAKMRAMKSAVTRKTMATQLSRATQLLADYRNASAQLMVSQSWSL